MSNKFDYFDNLNSYLDTSDDYDFPEDEGVGESSLSNLEPELPEELSASLARGQKKRESRRIDETPAVPQKKKPPPKWRGSRHGQRQFDEEEEDEKLLEDDEGHVESSSSIVSSTVAATIRQTQASSEPANLVARRQQKPELINLVDCPTLVLPGMINLDSDEEFDSENYEISLKVKWLGKIERIPHRKHQKFSALIEQLAQRVGADPNVVILDVDGKIIGPEDTPDSIGLRISQFISGRVVEGILADVFGVKASATAGSSKSSKPKTNAITLKVQSDRWKKPMEVQVEKDRKMMVVVIKCAEELKCRPADIKLSFDGESVEMDSTPVDLELEGGEVLDLRLMK